MISRGIYSLFSLLFVSPLLDSLDLLSSFFSDFPSFDLLVEDELFPEDDFSPEGDL